MSEKNIKTSSEKSEEKIIKKAIFIRLKELTVYDQIQEIKELFGVKSEAHICNEALKLGLPIYKQSLETPGGLEPSNDPKMNEFLSNLNKLQKRVKSSEEIQNDNNMELLLLQAKVDILMQMISSIYSRQKLSWNFEQGYPELSKEMDDKMDNEIPAQFENKLNAYKEILFSEEEDE